MKWVRVVVGAVIAISVVPVLMTTVTGLTAADGALFGTTAGTLLDLSPLVLVAGILAYIFTRTGGSRD